MRIIIPNIPAARTESRRCAADDCNNITREGKPFCTEHVGLNPYAVSVLTELDRRSAADKRASVGRSLPEDVLSTTAVEILQFVRQDGPRTLQRLCREINVDVKTMSGYIRLLHEKKLIEIGTTKRGNPLIKVVR